MAAKEGGYSRSYSGFIYSAKRLGLCGGKQKKPNTRKSDRRYPEILVPGEKMQVDVLILSISVSGRCLCYNEGG